MTRHGTRWGTRGRPVISRRGDRGHRFGRAVAALALLVVAGSGLVVLASTLVRSVGTGSSSTTPDPSAQDQSPAQGTARARVAPVAGAGRGSGAGTPGRDSRWLRVLDEIDARREVAWRRGRPDLLRTVYLPGTRELAEDQRMLQGYRRRGLRVSGVAMRFLAVEVLRQRPDSVALLAVDELGAALAHDSAGDAEPLPNDRPTTHHIALRLVHHQWRIADITLD